MSLFTMRIHASTRPAAPTASAERDRTTKPSASALKTCSAHHQTADQNAQLLKTARQRELASEDAALTLVMVLVVCF
jgi:hypothetical protein